MLLQSLRTLFILHIVVVAHVALGALMSLTGTSMPFWPTVTEGLGVLESIAQVVALVWLYREQRGKSGGERVQTALILSAIDLLLALIFTWRYHFSQMSYGSIWLESIMPIVVGNAATLFLWLSLTPLADERESTVGLSTALLPLLGIRFVLWTGRALFMDRLFDVEAMRSSMHLMTWASEAMSIAINVLFVLLLQRLIRQASSGDYVSASNAPLDPAVAPGVGREVTIGLIWLAVGIGVTAASFAAAQGGGGRYVVAYGAVIVGIARIIRALGRKS